MLAIVACFSSGQTVFLMEILYISTAVVVFINNEICILTKKLFAKNDKVCFRLGYSRCVDSEDLIVFVIAFEVFL